MRSRHKVPNIAAKGTGHVAHIAGEGVSYGDTSQPGLDAWNS